jgi:hypothetical protein
MFAAGASSSAANLCIGVDLPFIRSGALFVAGFWACVIVMSA